jgi:uncharacterized protein
MARPPLLQKEGNTFCKYFKLRHYQPLAHSVSCWLKTEANKMMFPVMLQGWHEISFFHWSCDPQLIQPRLPDGLEVDTFDGKAWVSITPFRLTGLRPPLFPRALGQTFPETNVRTYVRGPEGPAIWFFSLDAARLNAVVGARATYGLPYYWSNMQVQANPTEVSYFTDRGGRATARIRIAKKQKIEHPSSLDDFLTARFRLYSTLASRLITAEVEHPPWPLHRLEILQLDESLRRAKSLDFPTADFLTHYSPGVDTKIGLPHLVRT